MCLDKITFKGHLVPFDIIGKWLFVFIVNTVIGILVLPNAVVDTLPCWVNV